MAILWSYYTQTDGGRYRAKPTGDILDFTVVDNSFDVLGSLHAVPSGELVIYNLGSTGANAYAGDNRVSINNTSTIDKIVLSSATLFPFFIPTTTVFYC